MKQKNDKMSLFGRVAKLLLRKNMSYPQSQFFAAAFLLLSIVNFMLGTRNPSSGNYIAAVGFGIISLIWFLKAGHIEIIQKEYIEKDSDQSSEPT